MKCNKCGKELDEYNTFCTNCGNKIDQNSDWKINNKKTKLIVVYIIIIIFIITIITIYIKTSYQRYNNKHQDKESNSTITKIEEDNLAIDILNKGDYVNYIDSTGNTIICRVLYDNNSQYGLQIISDKSVELMGLGSPIQDQRISSYNNAVNELNNKAKEYMNINLSDNARSVGSNPSNPDDKSQYYKISDTSMEWLNEKGQFKNPDNNYKIDLDQMEELGIININTDYWLSSRCGFTYETKYENFSFISRIDFAIRKVTSTGELSSTVIIGVGKYGISGGVSGSSNIRPVFYIKSNVNVISGDGTKELPYVLGY